MYLPDDEESGMAAEGGHTKEHKININIGGNLQECKQ